MPPRTKQKTVTWDMELEFSKKNPDLAEALHGRGLSIAIAMLRLEETIRNEGRITPELALQILGLTGKVYSEKMSSDIIDKLGTLKIPKRLEKMNEILGKEYFIRPTKQALIQIATTVNSVFYGQIKQKLNCDKLLNDLNSGTVIQTWLKKCVINDFTLFSRTMRALYYKKNIINFYKKQKQTIPLYIVQTTLIDIFFKKPLQNNLVRSHINFMFFLIKHQWVYVERWFMYLQDIFDQELLLGVFLADLKSPALCIFPLSERVEKIKQNPYFEDLEEGFQFLDDSEYKVNYNSRVTVFKGVGDNENTRLSEYLIKDEDIKEVEEELRNEDALKRLAKKADRKKRKSDTHLASKSQKKPKIDDNNNAIEADRVTMDKVVKKKKVRKFSIQNFLLSRTTIAHRNNEMGAAAMSSISEIPDQSKKNAPESRDESNLHDSQHDMVNQDISSSTVPVGLAKSHEFETMNANQDISSSAVPVGLAKSHEFETMNATRSSDLDRMRHLIEKLRLKVQADSRADLS